LDDDQLEREIEAVRYLIRVRLRRYNQELSELERDLRELKALQRKRRSASAVGVSSGEALSESASPSR
jgi:hypothetical protein